MQKLHTLRRKIDSTEQMQSVVTTMKALAAVNIRQYEHAVQSLQNYMEAVELGLRAVLRQHGRELGARRVRETGATAVVVLGSQQGMAGQFNEQILRHATEQLEEKNRPLKQTVAFALGERVVSGLEESGIRTTERFGFPGSLESVSSGLDLLLSRIQDWYSENKNGRVYVMHNRPSSAAAFRPVTVELLPISRQWLSELAGSPWPTRNIPMLAGSWRRLYGALIRQYIFGSLVRAFVDSLASENASRLASMQAAEKNIAERLEELQSRYNRQRQSSITSELLDIVAGFEALTSS